MARHLTQILSSLVITGLLGAALIAPTQAEAKWTSPYNHPEFEWYTIDTEHFYVHYAVSKKDVSEGNAHAIDATWAARKMATVADEMFDPMCAQFDYYLKEKVHIVLLEAPDDLEGFTVPAFDFIEISANPGGSFYRMRGRMEWFADVLVHEFAHVVSLKQGAPFTEHSYGVVVGGLYSDGVNDVFSGFNVFIGDTDPTWWVEGGAEYWSDNAGYNWWTPSRDLNLRNTVLEDRLLTVDEWISHGMSRDYGDGERRYQQGYSFALYLRERFGDPTYTRMSQVAGSKWKADWRKNVKKVTGFSIDELYEDWKAYLTTKYTKVSNDVKAEGEVVGREMLIDGGQWEYTSPRARDKWMQKKKADRERKIERTGGMYNFYPKYSEDGQWFAKMNRGRLVVKGIPENLWPAFGADALGAMTQEEVLLAGKDAGLSIRTGWDQGFDFVPGANQLVMTGHEDDDVTRRKPVSHLEDDGFHWNQIYLVDLDTHTEKRKHLGGKEAYQSLHYIKGNDSKKMAKHIRPIPNTLRGSDPRVSPDGKRIVYFEYGDGTLNLVMINLDGSEKTYLTEFHDGSWLQNADWSADGSKIVFGLFRNYRQDLYTVDVKTKELTALTRDKWESQDAHWTADNQLYFSSEPTGIFNIFRMDMETREVYQVTNVVQGAEMPSITPDGNLLYVNLTGHGWKVYGIAKEDFFEKKVDYFTTEVDPEEVAQDLAYSEDLSYWADKTTKYHSSIKNWMSPTILPVVRFQNQSMTNLGLSAGFQAQMMDYVENHSAFLAATLGEDNLVQANYSYQKWYTNISLFAGYYGGKFDFAYLLDDDNDLSTTYDQSVFDGKQQSSQQWGGVNLAYQWNNTLNISLYGVGRTTAIKSTINKGFNPFRIGWSVGGNLLWNEFGVYGRGAVNARGGRVVQLGLSHSYTNIVFASQKGHDTDDGQVLDKYQFNTFQFNWTEHRAFDFKSDWLKKRLGTFQFNGQAQVIDRNVQYQDEFRAGGNHPFYVGSGAVQPNNQFMGYPAYSLVGETLLVVSGAYRFAIKQDMRQRLGPLHLRNLFVQFSGTAGNLWSYKISDEALAAGDFYYDGYGQRVAKNPDDVKREIPFLDTAYKNGNKMLYDAGLEFRLSSLLMNSQFDSFVRFAYGFNTIGGINDVNGDDISNTTDPGTGNSLSAEKEYSGLRVFVGIGTGW